MEANGIESVIIAAPCSVSWDNMKGSDTVRHCVGCQQSVYNLSAMTQIEADEFLQANQKLPCLRFFRRSDGTIMTDNCPRPFRKARDVYHRIAALASSAVAAIFLFTAGSVKAEETKSGQGESTKTNLETNLFEVKPCVVEMGRPTTGIYNVQADTELRRGTKVGVRPQDLVAEGDRFLHSGNIEQALMHFKRALGAINEANVICDPNVRVEVQRKIDTTQKELDQNHRHVNTNLNK